MSLSIVLAGLVAWAAGCQSDGANPMKTAKSDGWAHYGMDDKEWGDTVALGAVSGDHTNVIVEGTITEVCQMKGCWMRVADGQNELFVRFQDYSFFVPMNAMGHDIVMHGTAVETELSVEELRHYAEDAGKSPEEIAAITEPQMRVTFYADSVYIAGPGLDAPHSQ
jgi:hypothetical protein